MQNGAKFFDAEKYSIAISNLSFVLDVIIFDKCSRTSTFGIQDFCQFHLQFHEATHSEKAEKVMLLVYVLHVCGLDLPQLKEGSLNNKIPRGEGGVYI